jgi:photosystem II stability/assembly factor-like uncharacterized protein
VDAGVSWSLVLPAITSQSLNAVWHRRTEAAWAVGDQGLAPRTVGTPACFPDDLIGYAAGASGAGAILRTDDGGVSWQAQAAHASRPLNDIFFVDALRGWAVGDGGTIVHTARGGGN